MKHMLFLIIYPVAILMKVWVDMAELLESYLMVAM